MYLTISKLRCCLVAGTRRRGTLEVMSATQQPTPSGMLLAKKAARDALKNTQGVAGVGIGDGVIRVYVLGADVAKRLPQQIQGVPIEFVVTGNIQAR